MKTCAGCGINKPLTAFTTSTRTRDGREARCRECLNAAYRERYQRNIEHAREKKRAYRAANADAIRAGNRERTRKWRKANPERAREQGTTSARFLHERDPDYHRRWYRTNIDKERARSRAVMAKWRQENPEGERERKRRYRKANADVVRKRERENTHRRRALMGSTSSELADFMEQLSRLPCVYCGTTDDITIDHVIPLSRGGTHAADNLVSACQSCNCSKGAKLLDEWSAYGDPVVP